MFLQSCTPRGSGHPCGGSSLRAAALVVLTLALGLPSRGQEPASPRPGTYRESSMFRFDLLNSGRADSERDAKGQLAWTFTAANKISVTPVIADGVLYVGDWGGVAYAVDVATGTQIWATTPRSAPTAVRRKEVLEDVAPTLDGFATEASQYYSFSSPCVDEQNLYIATQQGLLTAFRRKDGEKVWERAFDGEIYSSPRVLADRLLVGSTDKKMWCLDKSTGEPIWNFEAGDWIGSSCAVTRGGSVVFVSHDKQLYLVDLATGELKSRFEIGYRSTGAPAITKGCAYFCTTGRRFNCVSLSDGRVRWYKDTGVYQYQQGIGVWKDTVVAAFSVTLNAYDAVTGAEKWRFILDAQSANSPTIGPELAYLVDDAGHLYAVQLADGKLRWKVEYGKKSWSNPILNNGRVYVCDGLGRICCYE